MIREETHESIVFFIRSSYNVTEEVMFRETNYLPGKRRWSLQTDEFTIDCIILIEDFRRATNYIKVSSFFLNLKC